MPFDLRTEQKDAVAAVFGGWNKGYLGLLVEMTCGAGKSVVIAALIADIIARWPETRILLLSDVQEIIKQDYEALLQHWPLAPVGLNAAALDQRDYDNQIVIAQLQSVYRTAHLLGKRHLVIVDEAHKIPRVHDSMYRSVFDAVDAKEIVGFSATCYRLDSGKLTEGPGALFSRIVFKFGYREALLAAPPRVVPVSSKNASAQIDTSKVKINAGEFVASQLEDVANDDVLVKRACEEIIDRCLGRRSVLIFCCGVSHAFHVADVLRGLGETAETVEGNTPQDERERIVEEFRAGRIRFVTNVGVLTTGSNIPPIDAIALLRATMSTGLYEQIVGRGFRPSPETGKKDLLLLDFGGNIQRHGPIDNVDPNIDPSSLKVCPECQEVVKAIEEVCSCCGYQWETKRPTDLPPERKPRQLSHGTVPDETPPQTVQWKPEWVTVNATEMYQHMKYGDPTAPPTLRVEYLCGLRPYSEYICFEHQGYARRKAEAWWTAMGGAEPVPATVAEAIARVLELNKVTEIVPVPDPKDSRWWRIREHKLSDGSIVNANFQRWKKPEPEMVPFNDAIAF